MGPRATGEVGPAEAHHEGSPEPRPRDVQGLAIAGLVACISLAVSWLRHANHRSGFDLAIFDQAVWQLSEGRAHISIVERHVLSDHLSPVVYLFAPLYRLVSTPAWLLGAQAAAVGATVLPVRAIARHLGASVPVATALVVGSAPMWSASLFDFHPSTLAVPFIAAATLAALRGDRRGVLIAAVAIGICRADLGIVLVALAIVAARRVRLWLGGTGLLLVGLGAALPARFGESHGWSPYFGHLGDGPVDVLRRPWEAIGATLSDGSPGLLLVWAVAGGILVLTRPRWIVAMVIAGAPILLSRWEGTGLPWYHYAAPIAPLAIAGTLQALASPRPRWLRSQAFAIAPGLGIALGLLLASPLSPGAPDSIRVWSAIRPNPAIDAAGALEFVGDDEVVSAHDNLLPHLSQRRTLYLYPVPFGIQPSYFPEGTAPDLDRYRPDEVDVLVGLDGLVDVSEIVGYEVVARPRGFVVLRREGG